MTEYQASERRGCRIMGISRSLLHYCPDTGRDIPVVEVLQKLAHQYPAYGFGLMFSKIRQAGLQWNAKRVYRVYRLLKLNFRRKGKKRLPNRHPQPLAIPLNMNHCWSVDFMSDALVVPPEFSNTVMRCYRNRNSGCRRACLCSNCWRRFRLCRK